MNYYGHKYQKFISWKINYKYESNTELETRKKKTGKYSIISKKTTK